MRHQVRGRHLGRTSAHRSALRRNLAASLFEHGTISTTAEKAKFVKPFAEKLITLAKEGTLHARRRAISLLKDRAICKVEDGESVKVGSVVGKLFAEIGPSFSSRAGGYTRIISLPLRRVGDNGKLVLLQLVGEQKSTGQAPRTERAEARPQDEASVSAAGDESEPDSTPEPDVRDDAE